MAIALVIIGGGVTPISTLFAVVDWLGFDQTIPPTAVAFVYRR